MNLFIVLLASVAVLTWLLVQLNAVIGSDGLGHRPAPRSHHDEETHRHLR